MILYWWVARIAHRFKCKRNIRRKRSSTKMCSADISACAKGILVTGACVWSGASARSFFMSDFAFLFEIVDLSIFLLFVCVCKHRNRPIDSNTDDDMPTKLHSEGACARESPAMCEQTIFVAFRASEIILFNVCAPNLPLLAYYRRWIDSVSLLNCCPWKTHKLFKCTYIARERRRNLRLIPYFDSFHIGIRCSFFSVFFSFSAYKKSSLRMHLSRERKRKWKNKHILKANCLIFAH